MADPQKTKSSDPWEQEAANFKASPTSTPSSAPDDDWKIWQDQPQESAPQPGILSRLGHALTAPIGSHFDKYNEETQKLHDIANGPPTIDQSQHPVKNFIHRALAGTEADVADQLTPLFAATVGGGQMAEAPGAAGKLAKVAMTAGGAGMVPAGANNIYQAGTENTPEAWGQRLGGAAQMAGGAAALSPAVSHVVPTRAKAGKLFESVMGDAENQPVQLNNSGNALLRVKELADRGTSMPQAANKLLKRVTDPDQGPLTYREARDFATNLSRLSSGEVQKLTPVMQRQVGELSKAFNADVGEAAQGAGRGEDYANAMKTYRNASRIRNGAITAAKVAVPIAAGNVLLRKVAPMLVPSH